MIHTQSACALFAYMKLDLVAPKSKEMTHETHYKRRIKSARNAFFNRA